MLCNKMPVLQPGTMYRTRGLCALRGLFTVTRGLCTSTRGLRSETKGFVLQHEDDCSNTRTPTATKGLCTAERGLYSKRNCLLTAGVRAHKAWQWMSPSGDTAVTERCRDVISSSGVRYRSISISCPGRTSCEKLGWSIGRMTVFDESCRKALL
jgi:hypothetical protein